MEKASVIETDKKSLLSTRVVPLISVGAEVRRLGSKPGPMKFEPRYLGSYNADLARRNRPGVTSNSSMVEHQPPKLIGFKSRVGLHTRPPNKNTSFHSRRANLFFPRARAL
jgi:hypothetical protein